MYKRKITAAAREGKRKRGARGKFCQISAKIKADKRDQRERERERERVSTCPGQQEAGVGIGSSKLGKKKKANLIATLSC